MKLLAISREDGWGIVADGKRMLLLKPPYILPAEQVPNNHVENAVNKYGYEAVDMEFSNIDAVVVYLNDECAKTMPNKDEIDDRATMQRVLDMVNKIKEGK